MVPNWCIKGLMVCTTVYSCVCLKYPWSLFKMMGLSPGSGFLSVDDKSINMTKSTKSTHISLSRSLPLSHFPYVVKFTFLELLDKYRLFIYKPLYLVLPVPPSHSYCPPSRARLSIYLSLYLSLSLSVTTVLEILYQRRFGAIVCIRHSM